jgi:hypothetical protein
MTVRVRYPINYGQLNSLEQNTRFVITAEEFKKHAVVETGVNGTPRSKVKGSVINLFYEGNLVARGEFLKTYAPRGHELVIHYRLTEVRKEAC